MLPATAARKESRRGNQWRTQDDPRRSHFYQSTHLRNSAIADLGTELPGGSTESQWMGRETKISEA